ncbi:hypothetical protein BAE44_0000180 [Dichanthelium oligosanthes]|uniref:Uncharacterized protein n=1 Tax=Dichanthelium oligosanthes TaxID=888268 RepID=A0A1E5WNR8_9POAL|nr:hypothetical protein BAE44_0000180 [Dichanthelium oligosanthes]
MAVACAPLAGGREIGGPGLALGGLFTEAELAAADLLVQLSGSAGGDDEAAAEPEPESPRSVNTCAGAAAWEEKEEAMGLELDRRARKKYRLLSELYDATRPVAGADAGNARKRKRGHQPEAVPETTMRYGSEISAF